MFLVMKQAHLLVHLFADLLALYLHIFTKYFAEILSKVIKNYFFLKKLTDVGNGIVWEG